MPQKRKNLLEVLICTYGEEGLRRIEDLDHPRVEGVRYVIACQNPDGFPKVPDGLRRDDVKIVASKTRGLSHNRNIALEASEAHLLLIADDDISFTADSLRSVAEAFSKRPECDFLTFRFNGEGNEKTYPAAETPLVRYMPKNYHVTSFEVALRKDSLPSGKRFNEHFGIGATFPLGEENLFINDLIETGLKGVFVPITICRHEGTTTGNRILADKTLVAAHGAVVSRLYPISWFPRMILFAWRNRNKKEFPGFISVSAAWLKGVVKARIMNAFGKPLRKEINFSILHDGARDEKQR